MNYFFLKTSFPKSLNRFIPRKFMRTFYIFLSCLPYRRTHFFVWDGWMNSKTLFGRGLKYQKINETIRTIAMFEKLPELWQRFSFKSIYGRRYICVFKLINGRLWQHCISLQDVYTASLEKSIVHTSMPSSVWEVVSECLLRTSSRRRIFFSRVTISSFQFVAALSKAKHAFFCMFRTVLGWLARPSLLKQSISSFLQPPSTRMV